MVSLVGFQQKLERERERERERGGGGEGWQAEIDKLR